MATAVKLGPVVVGYPNTAVGPTVGEWEGLVRSSLVREEELDASGCL